MPENISNNEYEKLISKTIDIKDNKSKSIVEGKIVAIENDMVIVDVGLKSEGRIPINEFSRPGIKPEIETGQKLNVYIENVDSINGETKLSREKAVKQKAWNFLQDCYENNKVVSGTPYNRVKGGMSVDLDGVTAFLPGSQVDIRPVRDVGPLMGSPQPFQILKMDRARGNIVVSRRAVLEETRAEERTEKRPMVLRG